MKKLHTLLTGLCLFLFAVSFTSCSSDEEECQDWALEAQDEVDAVTAAAMAFGNDPTNTSLCQAWVDAYDDLLDAYRGAESCAEAANQVTEWRQALDDAQDAVDAIVCP